MIKLFVLFLAPLLFAFVSGKAALSRNNRHLQRESSPLTEPIVKALSNRMASVLEIEEIPIFVHEVKSFNGLATSDGTIYLTRGALDSFYRGSVTGEELVSVIAHELGHVALGHSKRRLIDFSMQNAVRIILSLAISRLIPAVGAYIANLISSAIASKLSQKDEYEADAYAAALLSKSGIGTAPQISLLKKLNTLSNDTSFSPQWFRSHPAPKERISAIESLTQKWEMSKRG
ncbi:MAG: M48 family metalloprotease [Pseudomonadota bacterium]|nr:M48 family metalloprotease [Pseudomonadota bacterium]